MTEERKPGADELATLFPQPTKIEIAGRTIEVKALSIGRLGPVAKALQPIVDSVDIGGNINLVTLIADHTEHAVAAVAAATGEPKEWIADLPPNEFLRLAATVFDVNRDFFTRHVAPIVGGFMTAMTQSLPDGAGPTPSAS